MSTTEPTGQGDGVAQTRRVLSYPRERIFEAFARAEELARWWGPTGFTNTFETFEFRSRGAWRFVMHGPDGTDYQNDCVFVTVDAPSVIVIQHASQPRFLLTITLTPTDGGTELSWHQAIEDPAVGERLRHIIEPANEQNLDRLTAVLDEAAGR